MFTISRVTYTPSSIGLIRHMIGTIRRANYTNFPPES